MPPDLRIVPGIFAAAIVLAVAGYAEAPALSAPAAGAGLAYTLDTPLDEIVAVPAGEAVIRRDIPGLLENSSYPMFHAMSLRLLASLSGGRLTEGMLARTEADLAALAPNAPVPRMAAAGAIRPVAARYPDPDFN